MKVNEYISYKRTNLLARSGQQHWFETWLSSWYDLYQSVNLAFCVIYRFQEQQGCLQYRLICLTVRNVSPSLFRRWRKKKKKNWPWSHAALWAPNETRITSFAPPWFQSDFSWRISGCQCGVIAPTPVSFNKPPRLVRLPCSAGARCGSKTCNKQEEPRCDSG